MGYKKIGGFAYFVYRSFTKNSTIYANTIDMDVDRRWWDGVAKFVRK
jgi:hypothetical protein